MATGLSVEVRRLESAVKTLSDRRTTIRELGDADARTLVLATLKGATALAEAPSGSTVELVGEGPFEVRRSISVHDRDLMLKAANPEVRPVIRLAKVSGSRRAAEPAPPLLSFAGGWIILDGLVLVALVVGGQRELRDVHGPAESGLRAAPNPPGSPAQRPTPFRDAF